MLPLVPSRITFCCLAVSEPHGASMSMPASAATESSMRVKYCVWALRHGAMAPSFSDSSASGIDELGVDLERRAEAVAGRAGAVRRVEREVARRRLLEAAPVDGAHEVLAERQQVVVGGRLALAPHDLQLGDAVGQLQRGLQRVGEAAVDALAHHEAVDDDLDRVLLVAGQALGALQELVDVDDLAVDAGARRSPGPTRSSSSVSYSPLRPRTTGARTWKRVPSGSSRTRSTICCGVWRSSRCRPPGSAGRRCGRTAGAGSRRSR